MQNWYVLTKFYYESHIYSHINNLTILRYICQISFWKNNFNKKIHMYIERGFYNTIFNLLAKELYFCFNYLLLQSSCVDEVIKVKIVNSASSNMLNTVKAWQTPLLLSSAWSTPSLRIKSLETQSVFTLTRNKLH